MVNVTNDPSRFDTGDPELQCFRAGVPRANYMPFPFQMFQTPEQVLIVYEYKGAYRTIYMDEERPAYDQSWMGTSNGRWEGDTLVIETTNFHDGRKWDGSAGNLHLEERLTRVAGDTILYEATMTDPTTWEAPWSIEVPWPMMEPPGLFEFACHEQNYGIINVLLGARVRAAEYEAAREEASRTE